MGLAKKHLVALALALALLSIVYFNEPLIERVSKITSNQLTVSTSDFPAGGKPTGPFEVTLTLLELPLLNKTTTAAITIKNKDSQALPKTSIELALFKRTSPYEYEGFTAWRKKTQTGDMGPYETRTANIEMRVEEPGLYILYAIGSSESPSYYMGNDVGLLLNVSADGTTVSSESGAFLEPRPPPPPHIPYLVKMDLDGVPAENRPVNLRVTIASLMDQKNVTFKIFLPEGFELVSGDLVWQGDLQKAMDETEISASRENLARGRVAEATLQRISEDKKVQMRATIKARLIGDARIIVYPAPELPVGDPVDIDCDLQGLYRPHPEGGGWQAVSYGGCLYVRVINATDGIFSEQKLPFLPRPQKTRSP